MTDDVPGEHLKVTLTASVVEDRCPDRVSVDLGDYGNDLAWIVALPTNAPNVSIDRVAPPEWGAGPLAGDVWRDRHGRKWFAVGEGTKVALHDQLGDWRYPPAEALQTVGPLELLFREGWSPPEPERQNAEPTEPEDAREAWFTAVEELVTFLRANPDVPLPTGSLTHIVDGRDDDAGTAVVQRTAEMLGAEVSGLDIGQPSTAKRFGSITYEVVYCTRERMRQYYTKAAAKQSDPDQRAYLEGEAAKNAPAAVSSDE